MPKIMHDVAWQDALEEFLLLEQSEGRAERTIEGYRYYVRKSIFSITNFKINTEAKERQN